MMPVVPLNMHLKWFLRIVAIKLIHHIEKCAGTPMPSKTTSTVMWKRLSVYILAFNHLILNHELGVFFAFLLELSWFSKALQH